MATTETRTEQELEELAEAAKREAMILGMEELCAFLRENPLIPLPGSFKGWNSVTSWVRDKDTLSAIARLLVPFEKDYGESYMSLEKMFGSVKFHVTAPRSDVCERVVVGTRIIPHHYVPEREEEIVEWRCNDDPLLEEPDGD